MFPVPLVHPTVKKKKKERKKEINEAKTSQVQIYKSYNPEGMAFAALPLIDLP